MSNVARTEGARGNAGKKSEWWGGHVSLDSTEAFTLEEVGIFGGT